MLAKYSIRTKIVAVVAFLLVAMTGMGLLAVRNMRAINANTVDIATSWMPSVRVLGDLRAGVITYRNVIREHMLSETLEEKQAMEKTLATVIESNTKIRAAYEPMITSPEERALYNEWVKLWESYKKGTEDVMALSRKAIGQIPREAHELNTKTVNKIGLDADAVLKKDIDLNNAGADKAASDAADSYTSALMMLAVILGTAVIAGIAVSFYLVRDVSSGIASIVAPMQALGKGDLSADVPHQGEKTEIGAMADTLQVFKQELIAKKAADEAAALDAEAKIERGRRVDGITRNFESVIGEIVQTVSSASTQLEASGHAVGDGRTFANADVNGGVGFRGSLCQRAVGGIGDRRAVLLGHRDWPSGAGIGAEGNRCGRPGPRHKRPGQPAVQGGEPYRRRGRAHQHHRRPDQFAGAQRHHRGGARRRRRPRVCGRGIGSEGARGADRKSHRRDQPADYRHSGRDPGVGECDQGDQRHH